jgi:hypothetical protein
VLPVPGGVTGPMCGIARGSVPPEVRTWRLMEMESLRLASGFIRTEARRSVAVACGFGRAGAGVTICLGDSNGCPFGVFLYRRMTRLSEVAPGCPRCGHPRRAGAPHCPQCGADLEVNT